MNFVDLGAYDGDTVEQFISWGQLLGDISKAKVYGFEPAPYFKEQWQDVHDRHIKHVKSINFYQKAAWIDNKGVEFSFWLDSPIGSTVMKEKRNWIDGEKISVESFDFSKWLKRLKGDIYVKIDIEGAEYPVLEKMIKDGTDKKCKLLMIEWHASKLGEEYVKRQKWIEKNLKCRWIEWR